MTDWCGQRLFRPVPAKCHLPFGRFAGFNQLISTLEPSVNSIRHGGYASLQRRFSRGLRESEPADEYPVYVTDKTPPAPDGLKLRLARGMVSLTWGEVLGAGEYRLYRRLQGEKEFTLLYRGLQREHVDRNANVIPALTETGAAMAGSGRKSSPVIYEYAVAAVNGNGEGVKSVPVSTDPASWLNWDPMPGEPFRRSVSTYDAKYDEGLPPYYPGSAVR